MNALRELQQELARAILDEAAAPAFASQVYANGIDGVRRVQVYRNNCFVSLGEALAAVYPVVKRLVGEAFFGSAAREYVRGYASVSGDIHAFGDQFGAFIAGFRGAAKLRYLADVARLEWAFHSVFHTRLERPTQLDGLRKLPGEIQASVKFRLQPACQLLESNYPALRIWQVNQPDWRGDQSVNLDEGGNRLLVLRRPDHVAMQLLSPGEFTWLSLLGDGKTLADAVDAACAVDSEFDLTGALCRNLKGAVLVEWSVISTCLPLRSDTGITL